MKPLRIILADDHALVRAGLRALLERLDGVEVVAEADDGRVAVALARQHRPDVVCMDIGMPELNGVDATAQLGQQCPAVRVLMLSMHKNEEYVSHALQAGAAGYLLKDAAPAELDVALQAVARGDVYLSPAVSHHVVSGYVQRVRAPAGGPPASRLTQRQREVLQLIAEGRTTKQIAATLHLSPKTVETHRRQVMERLAVHDIAGLVRYAVRIGLVSADS